MPSRSWTSTRLAIVEAPLRSVCMLALVVAGAAWPVTAAARPGDLDPSFGDQGVVITALGGDGELVTDLVRQPDGKLVAIGRSGDDFALARYEADGALDPTFGDAGIVRTALRPGFGFAIAGALQPDGKIIAVGRSESVAFTVVRYQPDGSLDASFGEGGIARTFVRRSENYANGVVVQADGKIVVAGHAAGFEDGHAFALALVRYLPDGRLDPSFGEGGIVATPFEGANAFGRDLLLQSDGKLVVTGATQNFVEGDIVFAAARYDTSGTLDPSFGDGGRARFGAISALGLSSAALQPDGKILIGGDVFRDHHSYFFVVRLGIDGKLDTAFGSGGTAEAVGVDFSDGAVVLQPDGGIVIGGEFFGPTKDFALARFLSDGRPDQSFGQQGSTVGGGAVKDAQGFVADLQPDGRIVLGGWVLQDDGFHFVLARFLGGPRRCGDANGDTNVTVSDAVEVLRAGAGLPGACLAEFCDVDGDHAVSVTDGVRVLRRAAGLFSTLRCGS